VVLFCAFMYSFLKVGAKVQDLFNQHTMSSYHFIKSYVCRNETRRDSFRVKLFIAIREFRVVSKTGQEFLGGMAEETTIGFNDFVSNAKLLELFDWKTALVVE
jgi:hypothetical protein